MMKDTKQASHAPRLRIHYVIGGSITIDDRSVRIRENLMAERHF